MFTGDVDPDKTLLSDETLKETLRALTGRNDLSLGETAYVNDYRFVSLLQFSPYVTHLRVDRPSVRMVNKYGEGRVFVAGDAAHVHTPRGGQVSRCLQGEEHGI